MGQTPGTAATGAVDALLVRMDDMADALGPGDGVAAFHRMYHTVTRSVRAELAAGGFRNSTFLARLTVVFAELYLDALDRASAVPPIPPTAWAPLFEARRRRRTAPVQFAVAGMNAHINYDLGVAVVATCRELGLEPQIGTPEHNDYLTMNAVLAKASERVKAELIAGVLDVADAALGRLDDVVGIWSITRARDAAWVHAETLWVLDRVPPVRDRYLDALGRSVGLAGRALLVPTL